MSSVADENSPPRQDPLSKTRRQSMLDSPSRVTRSQVRRLSSAPVEAPMSPKPSTRRRSAVVPSTVEAPSSPKVSTRRRSTLSSSSKNDADDQDEVSSVQEEADTLKSLPRRRSVRKSFADVAEEGPVSTRSSKLTSIEEDSKPISTDEAKPVTRRTRASMASVKTPFELEPDFPTTRRTRRSSISSISSITSSIVASPKRQTRSRKNLSPVPSPTFSEVSTMSEVPETSPATKTTPIKDSSPMTTKSDKLLGTPRQLQLNIQPLKTKESPVVSESSNANDSPCQALGLDSDKPSRRSHESLSLKSPFKSPLKFVESAMEDAVKSNAESIQYEENGSPAESAEMESPRSGRRSHRRQSLKSPLQFSESAMEDAEKSKADVENTSNEEIVEVEFNKSRSSMGRVLLSSNKSSRLSLSSNKSITEDTSDSPMKTRESTGKLSRKSSPLKFDVSDKLSPNKSALETSSSEKIVSNYHETSQAMSNGTASLADNELNSSRKSSTGKSPSEKFFNEDSNTTEVGPEQVFDVDDSSTDPSLVEVVVEKWNSLGRLSLSSNKATPGKQQSLVGSPSVSNIETKGRFSLSLNKTPAKSPKFDSTEVSNDGKTPSLNRFSLSSNKSTPFKSPKGDAMSQKGSTTPSILSSGFSNTPNKLSPANALKCDTPQLTSDEPPSTFLSRFSLSFNKSTPAKASPANSPKCESTPQLNESRRSSFGRLSLSSNKSPSERIEADAPKHFSDNEESNSVSSSDPSGPNEEMLNSSNKSVKPSPRKSFGNLSLNISHHQEEKESNDAIDDDTSDDASNNTSNIDFAFSSVNPDKSTPAKTLPTKSPKSTPQSTLPAKSPKNSPQVQLNESRRSSFGTLSLSLNKSQEVAEAYVSKHFSDNEESNTVSSSDPSEHNESAEKLNLSNMSRKQSPRKSTEKLYLTSIKSLNNSHCQPDNASSNSSDDSASDEAVNKIPDFSKSSGASRRASTGNLSSKSFTSDFKKARASMGPLINPLVSHADISEGKDDMSDSSVEIEAESNVSDNQPFGAGEWTLSPIKQDIPSKKTSLTPSSVKSFNEPERQNSPSNPFEKSTVFNEDSFASCTETSEQALETSVSSHKSSRLNISKNDENTSIDGETVDLNVSKSSNGPAKDSSTNVEKKLDSSKIFKAAAVLLSGGNISDFDDEESDDAQWQPVFSPATMTKKEQRLAKKAKKKAEKEARKKQKQEKALEFAVSSVIDDGENAVNDEHILSVSNSSISGKSKKRKSVEANLEISIQQDEELDTCEKTLSKKRKSLSQPECDLAPSSPQNSESPVKENIQSAKKMKKCMGEGFASDDVQDSNPWDISPVADNGDAETSGKKKKKTKAKAVELQLASEKSALKDKKKLKVSGDGAPVEDLAVKKKKQKLTSENQPVEAVSDILKMKKKKNKDLILQPSSAVEQNSNGGMLNNLPEKKKSKKSKMSLLDEPAVGLKSETRVKKSKKGTVEVVEPAESMDDLQDSNPWDISPVADNGDAETSGKKKKKTKAKAVELQLASEKSALKDKKKKLKKVSGDGAPVEDLTVKKKKQKLTSENQPVEAVSEILKMKKKKNKDLILQPSSAVEQNSNGGMLNNLPEKKSKKSKMSLLDEPAGGLKSETRVKKSKKGTVEVVEPAESMDAVEKPSKKLKKKKLKEKSVVDFAAVAADGSDSDDAPTSVSFSAGKSAALAMMEAAAENIKMQKDLRKEKMKNKLEKYKKVKLATMQRSKKRNHEFVESCVQVPNRDTASSKIYFDDKGNAQKVAPKRLPAELLESLSEQPPSKLVKRPDGSKGTVPKTVATTQSVYDPLKGVLGATSFGFVPLRNIMTAKKLVKDRLAEEAANFRQQSLFGNRTRRTPISATISYQDKLKASGKRT